MRLKYCTKEPGPRFQMTYSRHRPSRRYSALGEDTYRRHTRQHRDISRGLGFASQWLHSANFSFEVNRLISRVAVDEVGNFVAKRYLVPPSRPIADRHHVESVRSQLDHRMRRSPSHKQLLAYCRKDIDGW